MKAKIWIDEKHHYVPYELPDGASCYEDEMIKEVDREIAVRKKCYPQWIDAGKIKKIDADYRIEVMQWVADTLRDVKEFQKKINTRFEKDLLK